MASQLTEPIQFGKYSLFELIGRGGMAEVYKGRIQGPAGFERTFVVKRILPHLSDDPNFIKMFVESTVIVKEALEVISPQATGKQIKVVEQLTPVFYQTHADKDMLYQAVLNLLSNAVKYTPERGTITVQTTVDEAKRKVIARISDTGVGIPPKDLPFVFDKFYRAEANNHMAKGTGLGLSLVKHIIETVHRGRIFVESHVGKGSCFGFQLDLCD